MLTLGKAMGAWGTSGFDAVLKEELAAHADQLPLQQGMASSSSVVDAPVTVLILGVAELEQTVRVKAGIFYRGMVGGCACANDPTPESENTEYCELQLDIDKASAATEVTLLT